MKFSSTLILGFAAAHEREAEYLAFIAKHGKSYGTQEEYQFRLSIYNRKAGTGRPNKSNNGTPTSPTALPESASTKWPTGLTLNTRSFSDTEQDQVLPKVFHMTHQ